MTAVEWRRLAVFAAIFLLANLAFDAYRHGGLTTGLVGTALVTTAIATALYGLFLRLLARRRDQRR